MATTARTYVNDSAYDLALQGSSWELSHLAVFGKANNRWWVTTCWYVRAPVDAWQCNSTWWTRRVNINRTVKRRNIDASRWRNKSFRSVQSTDLDGWLIADGVDMNLGTIDKLDAHLETNTPNALVTSFLSGDLYWKKLTAHTSVGLLSTTKKLGTSFECI